MGIWILFVIYQISASAGQKNTTKSLNETTSNETRYLMDVVYWEQKPFLFTNRKGEIDGIIPQMLEQANEFCLSGQDKVKITNYKLKMANRGEFYHLVRSNKSYGEGLLKDIRKQSVFWGPVVAYGNKKTDTFKSQRNLRAFQLIKSKEIAVIVPREFISLPNKIIRGLLSCQQIFFLAILMAVLFGLVVWLLERKNNDDFPKTFIEGAGTSLYWSIVSMTTVGYGDITPKNPIGRFIASIWLFVGVMIGCIVVATMTDVVTGVSDLHVLNKRVSVVEYSHEAKTAENDYGAIVVGANSYEEVLEMVRKGEVFAGMMNADIAAWYQKEINDDSQQTPLRIVQKLPANLYVNCYLPYDLTDELKKIFKCMYYAKDEVYTHSIEAFQQYCHTDTLYIGSSSDLILHNLYVQILLGAVCALILIGGAYDVFNYSRGLRKTDGKTDSEKSNLMESKQEKINMNGFHERYPRI